VIEEEVLKTDSCDDDDDMPAKKPMSVCLRCEAKLKHEADGTQKVPKPL